jgi:hypothetical protein
LIFPLSSSLLIPPNCSPYLWLVCNCLNLCQACFLIHPIKITMNIIVIYSLFPLLTWGVMLWIVSPLSPSSAPILAAFSELGSSSVFCI